MDELLCASLFPHPLLIGTVNMCNTESVVLIGGIMTARNHSET